MNTFSETEIRDFVDRIVSAQRSMTGHEPSPFFAEILREIIHEENASLAVADLLKAAGAEVRPS